MPTHKPVIRILSNLPRSGGTLVGRCLGCMKGVVLLSEIHPRGLRLFNPVQQAVEWHGFKNSRTVDPEKDFTGAISLIESHCRASGKQLVIRDWAHLDYLGVPFLESPSGRPELVETLAATFRIQRIALVRHPIDLWISLSRLRILADTLTLPAFLDGYLAYAHEAARAGFVRYEDFTGDPVGEMRRVCRALSLGLDVRFMKRWPSYEKITGDVSGQSRGSRSPVIRRLPSPVVGPELLDRFHGEAAYQELLGLLGYRDPAPKSDRKHQ